MMPVESTVAEIAAIIRQYRTIAVVGLSPDPSRPSYQVAQYLQDQGYRIIPVNPKCQEILGERCYPNLRAIPGPVDIVDIFRQVEAIPGIVDEAIAIGAKVVWMQLGLEHPEAAGRARQAGLQVVMNRCLKVEHARLSQQRHLQEEGRSA
ncbi:MAG: CoA-binding protein [Desulfobacca sp.]|uniref:CoA-binding protein n=1 Tax=Desulfobacca sp. TaxID=2067990 RepID=UPI00404B7A81